MKTIKILLAKRMAITILIMMPVFIGCKQSVAESDGFVTVDVTANYPRKDLILQDFMDVEYIPLETTDEFVCEGLVLAVGKNIVIVRNRNDDGDIFIFDRSGKALRKINRKGQSREEYIYALGVVLDEDNDEVFVNDIDTRKIVVYDMEGNFKRHLPHKEGTMYTEVYSLDRKTLICHDGLNDNIGSLTLANVGQSFAVISKQDGSVTREIEIPFKEKKSIVIKYRDEETNMTYAFMPPSVFPIVPYFDNFALTEIAADTIYSYSPDHTMKPLIVRTPSVQSMDPEVFLLLSVLTDRYYFMESIKKENEFSMTDFVYDKQEKAIFRYTVYNGDYTNKEEVYMKSKPLSGEVPSRLILEAHKLVEDYEKGRLQGRLKEIAAELDEDDNPVIMLIKHKK